MMKKLVLCVAASATLAAAPAHAALISYSAVGSGQADADLGSVASAKFGDSAIKPGIFTDTLSFTTDIAGENDATLSISSFKSLFKTLTATLDGNALSFISLGNDRFGALDINLTNGTHTLVISGQSISSNASYSGTLSSPVPEPASWALSMLGIGLIGGMLRSRRERVGTLAAA